MFGLIQWIMAEQKKQISVLHCGIKQKVFFPSSTNFIASLDQRLQAYKLLAGRFGCFSCLSTLSPEELQTAAKTLDDSYPSDLDNSFVDELCHFAVTILALLDPGKTVITGGTIPLPFPLPSLPSPPSPYK